MTSPRTDAVRVAEARRWYKLLGEAPIVDGGATIVVTPDHPHTWDVNFALAEPGADPEQVIAAADLAMVAGQDVVIDTDARTDPGMEAALALAGFRVVNRLIEMLATAPITPPHPSPPITTRPVDDADSWRALEALIRIDHEEGLRTGDTSPAVSAGLIAAMRRSSPPSDYSIILSDGVPAGYGMTARAPNGLAIIENLFTLPQFRGRGLMSAFIAAEYDRLAAEGCDGVFLDAHAHDTPKHLYAGLGFRPVAMARRWLREKLR